MPKLAAAEEPKLTELTHNLLRGLGLMSQNITSENCLRVFLIYATDITHNAVCSTQRRRGMRRLIRVRIDELRDTVWQ